MPYNAGWSGFAPPTQSGRAPVAYGAADPIAYGHGPTSHAPKRRRRLLWLTVGLVLACGAGATAFFVSNSGSHVATITGTFILTDDALSSAGCVGQGAEGELGTGAAVTLSGPAEKPIATTKLATGVAAAGTCTFRFEFPKTKTNLATYAVSVATQPLTTMTRSELKTNDWHFDLRYGPETTTVTGSLTLDDYDTVLADCVGQGGYSDISEGATVVITDQTGRILSSGALEAGSASGTTCVYDFSLPSVRQDEQQYAVEITHRGKVVTSAAEMQSDGWTFGVTLGI